MLESQALRNQSVEIFKLCNVCNPAARGVAECEMEHVLHAKSCVRGAQTAKGPAVLLLML